MQDQMKNLVEIYNKNKEAFGYGDRELIFIQQ